MSATPPKQERALSGTVAAIWKRLGVPRAARNALVLPGPGAASDAAFALAKAARPLTAGDLWLLHDGPPPPRARFKTLPGDLAALAASRTGDFDLVVASGGLERGGLADAAARLKQLAALAAPGGAVVLSIATFAAPVGEPGAAAWDALLFPELASAGLLGDEARDRLALPAAAWLGMIMAAGLGIEAVDGHGGQPLPDDHMAGHEARLALFDAVELASGVIHVLARRPGGEA